MNLKKHGIDFLTASKVFADSILALTADRIDDETGEKRWHAIGGVPVDEGFALLIVAHVYRGQNEEDTIRIISAREASKRECRLYLQ